MTANLASASITATGATTTRTFGARFSDYINVIDYGADSTGVNDSTTAIQNAVNANTASQTNGNIGTIYFPRGTYKVTGTIYLPPAKPGTLSTAASFNGQIAGATLTVNSMTSGTIAVNQLVQGTGLKANQFISSQVTGTPGGVGTYALGTVTQTVGAEAMTTLAARAAYGSSSWVIRGDGPGSTNITGNVSGFIFDCSAAWNTANSASGYLMEGLRVANTNTTALTSGAIRVAGTSFTTLINCEAYGQIGFSTYDNANNARNIAFINCYYSGCAVTPPFGSTDCIGWLCSGNSHNYLGCEASGQNFGMVLSAATHVLSSCHFEVNNTALLLGLTGDLATETTFNGAVIQCALEGNGIGIDCANVSNSLFQGLTFLGETTGIGGVAAQSSSYGFKARDSKFVKSKIDGLVTGGFILLRLCI
jgi:hypothetical protein